MSGIIKSDLKVIQAADTVQLKISGNVIELRHMTRNDIAAPIQKLSSDYYIINGEETGEVYEFKHTDNRAENIDNVRQSLKKLRDLINANTERPENIRWITLTYAENMKDPERLYKDYEKFWKRFKRFTQKYFSLIPEYITAAEPQARGAWHLHCLFIFSDKAPFISNEDLKRLWGQGFVSIKTVKNVDNLGVYLNAYLTDMDAVEAVSTAQTPYKADRLKQVNISDQDGKTISKAVIKGSRLKLYPTHFRIYRCSKGIKRPIEQEMTYSEAMEIIKDAPQTYAKAIEVLNSEGDSVNRIQYITYNTAAKRR